MKIRTITYRRVRNLGNYETATVELEVALNPVDKVETAFQAVADYALYLLHKKDREKKYEELKDSESPKDKEWVERYLAFNERIDSYEI